MNGNKKQQRPMQVKVTRLTAELQGSTFRFTGRHPNMDNGRFNLSIRFSVLNPSLYCIFIVKLWFDGREFRPFIRGNSAEIFIK